MSSPDGEWVERLNKLQLRTVQCIDALKDLDGDDQERVLRTVIAFLDLGLSFPESQS